MSPTQIDGVDVSLRDYIISHHFLSLKTDAALANMSYRNVMSHARDVTVPSLHVAVAVGGLTDSPYETAMRNIKLNRGQNKCYTVDQQHLFNEFGAEDLRTDYRTVR
jgi:hypothetical protein